MEAHHLVGPADELTADEHGGDRRAAPAPHEGLLDLPAPRDLVQLVDHRVRPEVAEERPDGVAHAARGLAEDHHWLL